MVRSFDHNRHVTFDNVFSAFGLPSYEDSTKTDPPSYGPKLRIDE